MGDDEAKKEENPKEEEEEDTITPDDTDTAADDDKSKKRKAPPPARAGKRERKAASSFVPVESFKAKDARLVMVQGRGKPLLELEDVHEAIAATGNNSLELHSAFKLLFSARGKVTTFAMKSHLLEFNGYLPKFGDDVPEDKRNKMEEDAEAKASKKAFKLKSQEVKVLCDFFKLDRSGITSKEDLIDRLLDFLGTINEDLLKSNKSGGASKSKASKKKKKKAPAKKKKKKVEESEEDESEEDAEDEEEEAEEEEAEDEEKEKGDDDDDAPLSKQPTDKALRRWVKAYIACFNMDKATIKHALETASDKFGVDLSEKKQKIKQILTEEM